MRIAPSFFTVSPFAILLAIAVSLTTVIPSHASSSKDQHRLAAPTPPTVDPTYGLPLPAVHKAPAQPDGAPASWIWSAQTLDNQDVYFRRTFRVDTVSSSTCLYITVDDLFTLYINGQPVYTSPTGVNDQWKSPQQINIAKYLHNGQNVIAVQAHNVSGPAGMLAQLMVQKRTILQSDNQWKVSPNKPTGMEWTRTGFNDSDWPATSEEALAGFGAWGSNINSWPGLASSDTYMAHISLPVESIKNTIAPDRISGASDLPGNKNAVLTVVTSSSDNKSPELLLDFGREVAGRLALVGVTDGTVSVGIGESEVEATKSPWQGPVLIPLTPGKISYTGYSAFRYAHLIFPASPGGPQTVKLRVYLDDKYYPVVYKGAFNCSDPLLTRLWYTGAYTCHLCMQEEIWDAPKRDRALWIGDLHVSGEVINNVFADRFLMEHSLDALRSGRADEDVNGIPGYSAAYICTMADFYRHIGDIDYLKRHHEELLGLLGYIRGGFDDNNLFVNKHNHWAYTDWSPGFDNASPISYACTDMFTIRAVRDGVYLLGEMGDRDNAAIYQKWEEQLKTAARSAYPVSGTFGDRLQENAMAVYSGTATPDQYATIFDSVFRLDSNSWDKTGDPPYNNGVISPYYGNYLLTAMSMTGHTRDAETLMRSYWGGMVDEGAITFWEHYDPCWPKTDFHENLCAGGKFGTFVSLCHGWSAGPTNLLTDYVLGVRPTGAGFKTVLINPDLGDLSWVSGSVPTPRGPIRLYVQKTTGGLRIKVTLPTSTIATVEEVGKVITIGSQSEKSRLVLSKAGTFYLSVR